MKSLFPRLLEILDLKSISDQQFTTGNLFIGSPQVYGGQVLAQAIMAAGKTIDYTEKQLHSLHGYFLSPGNNDLDIRYEVENIKNGRSFSTRRVLAKQKDRTIFLGALSYHIKEEGLSHQASMPNVAQPESLTPFSELFAKFAEEFGAKPRGFYSAESPIIFHPVEYFDPFNPGLKPPRTHVWFKTNGNFNSDDDLILKQSILAYVSDFSLLISSLLPHNVSFFTTPMRIASLDHSMFFHRDFDLSDWHLYAVESTNAESGRAFCQGKIFSRKGVLVASTTQEGLIRKM